jgi:hypothetical protein
MPPLDDDDDLSLDILYASRRPVPRAPRSYPHLLHKVRFEPDLIRSFCDLVTKPASTPSARNDLSAKSSGGRPPKSFWDRLWASIAVQMFNGDFKPDKQADIEKAMHDWLARNSEDAGETAVRARAKLLWTELKKEDEN